MRKINNSFTVEYKNGRRKADRKQNSIWGDLDLKSVARQADGGPFSLPGEFEDAVNANQPTRQDSSAEPVWTPAFARQNNASATEEIHMPDENETVTETRTPDPIVTPLASAKQRKQRTKKAAADANMSQDVGAVPDGTMPTVGMQKRGRQAGTIPAASPAKSKPLNRARKTIKVAGTALVTAIDDMADLLKLEEENRSLRKQLFEKLRAENADLRKRLNLD